MENYELLSDSYDYKIETYEEAIAPYNGLEKSFMKPLYWNILLP